MPCVRRTMGSTSPLSGENGVPHFLFSRKKLLLSSFFVFFLVLHHIRVPIDDKFLFLFVFLSLSHGVRIKIEIGEQHEEGDHVENEGVLHPQRIVTFHWKRHDAVSHYCTKLNLKRKKNLLKPGKTDRLTMKHTIDRETDSHSHIWRQNYDKL